MIPGTHERPYVMPGLLKGSTGVVGQGRALLGDNTVQVSVPHLLAGTHGPFGEVSHPPWQPNPGKGMQEWG